MDGSVTTLSTIVPGGGFLVVPLTEMKNRVLMRFFTMTKAKVGDFSLQINCKVFCKKNKHFNYSCI